MSCVWVHCTAEKDKICARQVWERNGGRGDGTSKNERERGGERELDRPRKTKDGGE